MIERRLGIALLSSLGMGCAAVIGLSVFLESEASLVKPGAPGDATLTRSSGGTATPVALVAPPPPFEAEAAFLRALEQLEQGEGETAFELLQRIAREAPNYTPARPVYRQMVAAAGGPNAAYADAKRLRELAEEGRIRLASEKAIPPDGFVPNAVLQLAPRYRHLLVTDLERARLYVMENRDGALSLVRHHYASMGKNGAGKQIRGDNRTPIGVYHITGWLRDEKLPELYGAGAWPTNYPNPWDVFKGRTGYGIWLHGVPRDTESRAPRSSEGCVTMANEDLLSLRPYVTEGATPVVLSNELEWVSPRAQQRMRDEFLQRIEAWRQRWSALDTEGYLAFYADDFTAGGMNRREFAAHKRRVNKQKRFIKIQLSDVNLFRYPGASAPLLLAEFDMDYESSNYRSRGRKQQFWKQDASGEWKIFREENL